MHILVTDIKPGTMYVYGKHLKRLVLSVITDPERIFYEAASVGYMDVEWTGFNTLRILSEPQHMSIEDFIVDITKEVSLPKQDESNKGDDNG